jgi:nucleotide-binding universal stress UspA family protein
MMTIRFPKEGYDMTAGKKRILVPTSGYLPAKESGESIIEIAKRLDADVLVVHIRDPSKLIATSKESEGWNALRHFEEIGRNAGVNVTAFYTSGELVESLKRFALEHQADLILVGASANRLIAEWVTFELLCDCNTPILVVPQDLSSLIE